MEPTPRTVAMLIASTTLVTACAGPAAPAPPPASSSARSEGAAPPPDPPAARKLEGALVTYQGATPIGGERYRDDGDELTSEVSLGPAQAIVRISRSRGVRVGDAAEYEPLAPDTIALENGSWQAYALAAEAHADAREPRAVKLLLPGQATTVPATIAVTPIDGGGTRVAVVVAGTTSVEVELDAAGAVRRAAVASQNLVALPEGAPPPQVAVRALPSHVEARPIELARGGVTLRGEHWAPRKSGGPAPVVLMIAGSGPTDRDGNNAAGLRTDAYRKLAEELAARGVSSVRYDKRGVGRSGKEFDPAKSTLEDFVDDALAFCRALRAEPGFSRLVVLGHSEGGLIALRVAEQEPPDAMILLATAGRPVAALLREQLARQLDAATLVELDRLLGELRAGKPLERVPPVLAPLFPPAVHAFVRSELDIDPVALLARLRVPTTVIQGAHDAQVTTEDARLLGKARPGVKVSLVPGMSHVLKEEASANLPQPSYTDPELPLAPGLVDAVVAALESTPRAR